VIVVDKLRLPPMPTGVEKESISVHCVLREDYLAAHGSRPAYNGTFRKNYAGLGYTYNTDIDAFVPPQPFASWLLNESNRTMGCPCTDA
jgi:hypothetical protein